MKKRKRRMLALGIMAFTCTTAVLGFAVYAAVSSKLVKTAVNEFNPDEIALAVVENGDDNEDPTVTTEISWEADPVSPPTTYTAAKKVQIKNRNVTGVNNADAYLRVALIPSYTSEVEYDTSEVEYADADGQPQVQAVSVVSGNYGLSSFGELTDISIGGDTHTFTMGDVTFTLDSAWETYWFWNPTDGYFYYRAVVEPGETTEPLLASVSITSETYDILDAYDLQLEVNVLADSIQTQGGALADRWEEAGVAIDDKDSSLVTVQ